MRYQCISIKSQFQTANLNGDPPIGRTVLAGPNCEWLVLQSAMAAVSRHDINDCHGMISKALRESEISQPVKKRTPCTWNTQFTPIKHKKRTYCKEILSN